MIVHKNPYFNILYKKNYYIYKPKYKEVIVLPVIDKNKFLLIKAKRELLNKSIYELPAGSANKNESLINAARREMEEETGVKLKKKDKLVKMKSVYQIPNRNPKPVNAYYVKLKSSQISFKGYDKKEVSSIKIFTLKQVLTLIENNQLCTSVPIAIIMQYIIKTFKNKLKLI